MTSAADMTTIKVGETGTVLVQDIDGESVITRDVSDSTRSGQAIEDYAHAYTDGRALPPVEVFIVGGRMVLVDGWHRWQARLALRELGVVARCVGEGSMDDALRYALTETNQAHGLPLSPEDRKRRVFQAMDSGLWDSAPATTVAADLGMSHPTARKYMRAWEESQERDLPPTVVDSAGRERPRKVARPETLKGVSEPPPTEPALPEDPCPDPLPFEPEADEESGPVLPEYGAELVRAAASIKAARVDALRRIPEDMTALRQKVEDHCKRAEGALKSRVPKVCERCRGEGCDHCVQRGWTDRLREAG